MARAVRTGGIGAAALMGMVVALVSGGRAATGPRVPETVYDSTLKVTWLANADLAASEKFGLAINADGSMPYATAVKWVKRLNRYDHRKGWLGHHNWTLPITVTPYLDSACNGYNKKGGGNFGLGCTKAPLAELYTHVLGLRWPSSAVAISDVETGPFHDFQPYLYWSGVLAQNKNGQAPGYYTFSFATGWQGQNQPDHWMYALPLLPGNRFGGGATPALQSVDGGQAVYEPGAPPHGVTWLADADLAKSQPYQYAGHISKDGSMEEPTAANWVGELDSHAELGKSQGWSLPSPAQLLSLYADLESEHLVSPQQPIVPVPATSLHGVYNIQPYLYWSCAGTNIEGRCHGVPNPNNQQWSFSLGNGFLGTDVLQNSLFVEVYYPGPAPLPPQPRGHCPPPTGGHPTCV